MLRFRVHQRPHFEVTSFCSLFDAEGVFVELVAVRSSSALLLQLSM